MTVCGTCGGRGRIACPGPTKAKTNAERAKGREMIDWCWGMHMGHECPDCPQHNHMTRDIKPPGVCPKCDEHHATTSTTGDTR